MESKDELIVLEHIEALGLSKKSISDKKWQQLCVVYDTIKKMLQTSAELKTLLRAQTITVSNVERMVNEQSGVHISHALFYQKNKGGIINPFIESFKESTTQQARQNNEDENNDIRLLNQKLIKLAKRDYHEDLYKKDILTLIKALNRNNIPLPRLNQKYDLPEENNGEQHFLVFPTQKNKN